MATATAEQTVEQLRAEMVRVAVEKGSLTHPEVVALSQRLDTFLVEIQRSRLDQMLTTDTKWNVTSLRNPLETGFEYFVSWGQIFMNLFAGQTVEHVQYTAFL